MYNSVMCVSVLNRPILVKQLIAIWPTVSCFLLKLKIHVHIFYSVILLCVNARIRSVSFHRLYLLSLHFFQAENYLLKLACNDF